jgi:predicted amino acid dehydrogenase
MIAGGKIARTVAPQGARKILVHRVRTTNNYQTTMNTLDYDGE